jgi:DNA-binding CsgD family transcriptional regulator
MSVQQAVRYATGAPSAPIRLDSSPLTGREAQVATLVADGLTNGEIAGKLGISGRTVDAHVEHIRNKLGLRTRAQIAVWAHERIGTA